MLDFKLYAMTDRWLVPDLTQFAVKAVKHGLRALRMREGDMEPGPSMQLALNLQEVMRGHHFFVSAADQSPEPAGQAAGFAGIVFAGGFHVPERGIGSEWGPPRVRRAFPGMLCGVSVHSLDAARRAEDWGADFLTFGAVFETPSKRAMGYEPQGVKTLGEVVRAVKIPVFAIGGMTPAGAKACMEEGAWGVAVIRDLLLAPNLSERLEQYREVLGSL